MLITLTYLKLDECGHRAWSVIVDDKPFGRMVTPDDYKWSWFPVVLDIKTQLRFSGYYHNVNPEWYKLIPWMRAELENAGYDGSQGPEIFPIGHCAGCRKKYIARDKEAMCWDMLRGCGYRVKLSFQ